MNRKTYNKEYRQKYGDVPLAVENSIADPYNT